MGLWILGAIIHEKNRNHSYFISWSCDCHDVPIKRWHKAPVDELQRKPYVSNVDWKVHPN